MVAVVARGNHALAWHCSRCAWSWIQAVAGNAGESGRYAVRRVPGATVLDVTLTHGGLFRRWTITTDFPDGWACRFMTDTSVTAFLCTTEDQVVAKQRSWREEIAIARAEGWV